MKNLLILVVLAMASGLAGAQDRIYRCGNEYFNEVDAANAKNCILLEGKAPKTKDPARDNAPLKLSKSVQKESSIDKLLKQAQAGDADAQYRIAVMYELGQDVSRDETKAFSWLQRAAAQGHAGAQSILGLKYSFHSPTPGHDVVLAYAWTALAAGSGEENSIRFLNDYESKLTLTEKSEAQRLVSFWKSGQLMVRESNPAAEGDADKRIAQPARPGRDVVSGLVFFGLLAFGVIGYFRMRSIEKKAASAAVLLTTDKLVGVRGWLKFFVVTLGILGPILSLGRTLEIFGNDEMANAVLTSSHEWAVYKNAVWLTLAAFSAFNIYAALQLRFVWKPASVTLAKIAVASWLVATLVINFVIPRMAIPDVTLVPGQKFFGSVFWVVVSTLVWSVYLSRSKRVRATYFGDLVGAQSVAGEVTTPLSPEQAPPMNSTSPQTSAGPAESAPRMETEDELYKKVGQELDAGNTHKATWLKAFAETDGDEKVAKARYIKYRVDQLKGAQGG